MNPHCSQGISWRLALCAVSLLVAFAASTCFAQLMQPTDASDHPPALPGQEQPEVLSRGPVHEAFAEPVNLQFQAGLIAPDRPPQNIEEVPPNERPQGQQYVWIPGYWSWDAERRGYIWVSACWRVAPPRMSWVPGYWAQVQTGWEWVAGFWTPAGVQELEYLPPPPFAGDIEPYGPAPSPDTIWVPPCMYWVQGQYVRRNGYWLAAQVDWVWAPAHYVMTPRGYVFAAGHWDYALERRGVLFAPVYFPVAVYSRRAYTYSPSIVLDVGLLRLSLFAYPRYSHYYFGDYYDDSYVRIGIFPWFGTHRDRTWYDPVYEHTRWSHRHSEPRWEEHGREEYTRRRADTNLRPARTYREQEARVARMPEEQRRVSQVSQPLATVAARRESPMKFERITTEKRQEIKKQAVAVQTFGSERREWEQKKPEHAIHERKAVVDPKPTPREVFQPPKERKPAVVSPVFEKRESVQPPMERKPAVVSPVVSPPRESRTKQPERVQIPASPIVGQSGRSGIIFQRGPPSQPKAEVKDKEERELHRGKGSSR